MPDPTPRRGVRARRDIQARDIVTGVQLNPIMQVYHQSGGRGTPADYRAALQRYLAWLEANTSRVVLRGIKREGQQAIDLPLHAIYVPLAAEAVPEAPVQLKRGRRGAADEAELLGLHGQTQRMTLRELLAQGTRLAVTGAPGCGKTTVLQHIACTLAEALRTDQPGLATERLGLTGVLPLPIYVPLSLYALHRRQCADDRDPRQRQLATFITQYLIERQAGLNLPEDFFATLLDQGQHVLLLLDGLDEVPTEDERVLVAQAVQDLTHGRAQVRVVVTSRTQAYQGPAVLGHGFRLVRVLALEPAQVADLIQRAYQAIYPIEEESDERQRQATDLLRSVTRLEAERAARLGTEEHRLVTTPLLVRMLLIVHFNARQLPEQRAELYMQMVDTLLTSDYNPDAAVAQALARLGGDWRLRRDMLQDLALHMHSQGHEAGRELGERALMTTVGDYLTQRRRTAPADAETLVADLVASSRQRGGLLEERAGRYRFSHLSLQEFLTARALAEGLRDVARIAAFLEDQACLTDAWWREPILLTGGYLSVTAAEVATDLLHRLAHLDEAAPPCTAMALAAAELAATVFLEWGGAASTRQALAQRLVVLLTDPALTEATPVQRAAAGRALGRLGDPRPGVGCRGALPAFAWCEVPGGRFLMGANADEEAYDDEKPQHWLTLQTFYVARYPVTNAQFAPFIEDGGYAERCWWTAAGWAWRQGREGKLDLSWLHESLHQQYRDWLAGRPVEARHEPYYWGDERFNLSNQPVVGITWYEAMAYCTWLQAQCLEAEGASAVVGQPLAALLVQGGWQIRLPTEAEWEKAAGWDPVAQQKRVYAWGDTWDESRTNVNQSVGQPSVVGVFPAGAAMCGAMDMMGNVWEWTLSRYVEKYPYRGKVLHRLEGTKIRALRGGAWDGNARRARVSCRTHDAPANFNLNAGLRVVVAPAL
jgi:formylglycine-generating enzyme required for sulfatase activity/energy-coupling factor transporter ATP-binding protein EcfA2